MGSIRHRGRIGEKMTKENQNRRAWKAAIRGDTLPGHQALADGRRLWSADGERVVSGPDNGKDSAEQEPSET